MANVEADVDYDLECDSVDGPDSIGDYSGSNGARRPMNAFLIFCKRHRSLVREKYPHLENRSVTKILGELWANLESSEKVIYTELAKQYKEAFMKANPDFKWYKLPSPTLRSSPITRPANHRQQQQQSGSKLELGLVNHSFSSSPSTSASCPGSNPVALAVAPPCGVSSSSVVAIPLFKLADETQMGGLSSLINTPTGATVAAAALVTTQNLISKPPKKRYLENGAFRSQPAAESISNPSTLEAKPVSEDSSTSSVSTANDCSALLKLAEMCSHELVRGGPTNPNNSSVVINGHTMGNSNGIICNNSSNTTSSSATSSVSQVPNADYGLTDFGRLMASAMRANLAASGGKVNLNLFSSSPTGQDVGRSPGRGSSGEDQPLDLCTEKTITTSHQELIDCIVDTLCRDDEKSGPGGALKPPFPSSRLPKGIQSYLDGGRGGGGGRSGDKSGDRNCLSLPLKKAKGIRGSGAGVSDSASSRHSPGVMDARSDGGGGNVSDADDSSPRKSQRSCKGKRYRELLSEGIIQPAKERKLSSSSSKASAGDDRFGRTEEKASTTPPPSSNFGAVCSGGWTRNSSDSSESVGSRKSDQFQKAPKTDRFSPFDEGLEPRDDSDQRLSPDSKLSVDKDRPRKRFKTGDFDLDIHIAALPECNIEALDKRKQRRQGSSSPGASSRAKSSVYSFKDAQNGKRDGAGLEGSQSDDSSFDVTDSYGGGDGGSSSGESHSTEPSTPVGSQKRKPRKRSVASLDPSNSNGSSMEAAVVDNFKLVALAEVCEERMSSSGNNQNDEGVDDAEGEERKEVPKE